MSTHNKEAAAQICERIALRWQQEEGTYAAGKKAGALECAEAIRALTASEAPATEQAPELPEAAQTTSAQEKLRTVVQMISRGQSREAIAAINALGEQLAEIDRQIAIDIGEITSLLDTYSQLLRDVACGLKGEPLPLHRHGLSDLPEVARALRQERDQLRSAVAHQAPATEQTPTKVPYPHEQMDAIAAARYIVSESGPDTLWPYAVRVGDGEQEIYRGRKADCENVARKLAGAFLDGGWMLRDLIAAALSTPPAVPPGWKLVPDYKVGMHVKFGGEEYKIFAIGDRPGTFDICHPTDFHRDRWVNVSPDLLEPLSAAPAAPQGEQK